MSNSVIKTCSDGKKIFYCPGCEDFHALRIRPSEKSPSWEYNGDPVKPTFSPSILSTCDMKQGMEVCHSFVSNGKIQFLGDCTHELKNQTVDIPVWPYEYGKFHGVVD